MIEIIETFKKRSEYGESYEIEIKRGDDILSSMSVSDGLSECPEDAVLYRDLAFIYNALDFFDIGYEAAKNNEEVTRKKIFLNSDGEEVTEEEYNA